MIPAESRSDINSESCFSFCRLSGLIPLGELDDQQRVGIAAHGRLDHGLNIAMSRPSAIMVRSTSFDRDWPQFTRCCAASIAS
jgi:hypothetical protein